MKSIDMEEGIVANLNQLKHLKVDKHGNEYIVSLIDLTGYEIVRGFGTNAVEALNDMHSNLI